MRVTLLHQPTAGEGGYSKRRLVATFEDAGHTVAYRALTDGWPAALDAGADCVVAAGGDGTVAKVARHLVGRGVPLAILPLGTANNLATRLGACLPPEALAGGLGRAARRPLDLGVARGPWGERLLTEGAGVGAFARAVTFAKADGTPLPDPRDREAEIARDLRLLRAVLRDFDARRCTLALDDGAAEETPYLLVEISTTGLVGPNVALAPEADCGDGLLDLVVVGEAERERLDAYLGARLAGDDAPPPVLPVRRARSVRLTAEAARVHLDGGVWPDAEAPPPGAGVPFEVEVGVEPAALEVLVPAPPRRRRATG